MSSRHVVIAALGLSLVSAASTAPIDVCGVPGQPSQVIASVQASFTTWNQAGANQQAPPCTNLQLTFQGATSSVHTGADQQNLIVFRRGPCDDTSIVPSDDSCRGNGACPDKYNCWEPTASNIIAITTTSYIDSTGQIIDADMELHAWNGKSSPFANEVGYYFTCVDPSPTSVSTCPAAGSNCCVAPGDPSCLAMDVQNTVTHEAGHFIGFAHNTFQDSTMYSSASRGETGKRSLAQVDIDGACDVYQAQAHLPVNSGYVRTIATNSKKPLFWASPTIPYRVNDFTNVVPDSSSSGGCGSVGAEGLLGLLGLLALRRSGGTRFRR